MFVSKKLLIFLFVFVPVNTSFGVTLFSNLSVKICATNPSAPCDADGDPDLEIFTNCNTEIIFNDSMFPGSLNIATYMYNENINSSMRTCSVTESLILNRTLIESNSPEEAGYNMSATTETGQLNAGSYLFKFTHRLEGSGPYINITPFSTKEKVFLHTVQVASSQCSDGVSNDSDGLADTLDPQCHTDCNVNNPGSYVPSHTSETTPPNGSCPAPAATLQINGRAAFLHVVKNFIALITSKAFAGE